MHEQIFISGVWHSGTSLIAEIAKLNGYDLGIAVSSRNDSSFAWRGPLVSLGLGDTASAKDYDDVSIKGILEKSWPFDNIGEEESELFKNCITKSHTYPNLTHNCCKLPGLSLMTPHLSKAFPKAPIIHVTRNPIDVSLSRTDNYFLDRLVHDKVERELQEWEIASPDIIQYLFVALGGLEWTDIKFSPSSISIQANRKKILWNLLYTLRWALIADRLRVDIENHSIENHYVINFEKIALEDKEEILKLKNILGVSGRLRMPAINKAKVYKFESYLPTALAAGPAKDTKQNLKLMYEISEPYLEELGYERVAEFMKKLEIIK